MENPHALRKTYWKNDTKKEAQENINSQYKEIYIEICFEKGQIEYKIQIKEEDNNCNARNDLKIKDKKDENKSQW